MPLLLAVCVVWSFPARAQQPIDTALPPSLPAGGASAPLGVVAPPTPVPNMPVTPPGQPQPAPFQPRVVEGAPPQPPAAEKPSLTLQGLQKMINEAPQAIANVPKEIPDLSTIKKDISRAVRPLDPNKFNGENFEKLPYTDSMMFSEPELQRFYEAVKGNLSGAADEQVAVQVKLPKVAPTFYINSVLYEGPRNWTIWLNSRRIRVGATFPELEIRSVKNDLVEFVWKTDQLDYISPNWDQKIKAVAVQPGEPIPEWAYVSDDKNVFVDQTRRVVRFFIGPHQSFVTRKMQVAEGKLNSYFFPQAVPTAPGQPGALPGAPGAPRALPGGTMVPGMPGMPARGPGLSNMGLPGPTPVISGAIPGAAPGSPMGGSFPLAPMPGNNSLNPMAMPPVMMAPAGSSPVVGNSPLINSAP